MPVLTTLVTAYLTLVGVASTFTAVQAGRFWAWCTRTHNDGDTWMR